MPFWLLSNNSCCESGKDLPVPEKFSTSSTFKHFKISHKMTTPTPTIQPRNFIFNDVSGNLQDMGILRMSACT